MRNHNNKVRATIASSEASKIIKKYYVTTPEEIDLEGFIYDSGGFIEYSPLNGAEGNVIIRNDKAIITVNSNINNEGKKRFVLAHEFGHFVLHKKPKSTFFNCDVGSFLDWNGKRPEETEANIFAAELLMPKQIFTSLCKGKKFSFGNIKKIANIFQTSFLSTAIRFVDFGNYPCAVIYIKKGIIQWSKTSEDFPLKFISSKTPVPYNTVARDILDGVAYPDKPEKVEATAWFMSDFNVKKFSTWYFYEQCILSKKHDVIISFLWSF